MIEMEINFKHFLLLVHIITRIPINVKSEKHYEVNPIIYNISIAFIEDLFVLQYFCATAQINKATSIILDIIPIIATVKGLLFLKQQRLLQIHILNFIYIKSLIYLILLF